MEAPSNKKVLITGIDGFTGKHLEKYFIERGFEVYGITLQGPEQTSHFQCDILEIDQISDVLSRTRPDYIVHLAAISFVASKNIEKMYHVNIIGTLNLLDAILDIGLNPDKILIASSAAVYGNVEGELSESFCPCPVNHYGNSKLAMENMVKGYFDKLRIILTRPFNYTGPGQEDHFLIPKIISHYKQTKKRIELGNIDVFREFNDVDLVIKYYADLLISDFDSGVINVCSGQTINIKYILEIMNKISNYQIDVGINPDFVRKNEIIMLKGSIEKLRSLVGDHSKKFKIEDTLLKMYRA